MNKIYRGKKRYGKGWVYGVPMVLDMNGYKVTAIVRGAAKSTDGFVLDYDEVIPETVGQFTGLNSGIFNSLCGDKECGGIYEGDKVSITYITQGMSNSHEHTITGVVAFKEGSFVVEWDSPKKGKYKYQTLNSVKRLGDGEVTIKIIGNIHDNPAKDEIQP